MKIADGGVAPIKRNQKCTMLLSSQTRDRVRGKVRDREDWSREIVRNG